MLRSLPPLETATWVWSDGSVDSGVSLRGGGALLSLQTPSGEPPPSRLPVLEHPCGGAVRSQGGADCRARARRPAVGSRIAASPPPRCSRLWPCSFHRGPHERGYQSPARSRSNAPAAPAKTCAARQQRLCWPTSPERSGRHGYGPMDQRTEAPPAEGAAP